MSQRNLASRRASTSNLQPVGGVVSPLSIPGLLWWWDFSSTTFIGSTAAGVGGVTAGGGIGYCQDRSGNGHHLMQSVAGSRPTYSTSAINSVPGANFSTQTMATAQDIAWINGDNPFTIVHVSRTIRAVWGTPANNATSRMVNEADGFVGAVLMNNANVDIRRTSSVNTPVVGSVRVLAGSRNFVSGWRNGSAHAYGSNAFTGAMTPFTGAFTLGTLNPSNGSLAMSGAVSEFVAYSRAISDTERIGLERFYGNKYSITVL